MKKCLLVLVLLAFALSNLGATVHEHYCMGKRIESSFAHLDEKACVNCGMEKSDNGCCKDQHKKIISPLKVGVNSPAKQLCEPIIFFDCFELPKYLAGFNRERSPEQLDKEQIPGPKIPRYLMLCVFRI